MQIDLETVRRVFEDVLSGAMSREQADRWAYAVMLQEEAGAATYAPARDRDRIWAGVMYLYGLDTTKAPGEYLHCQTDIRAAMKAKLGERADIEAATTPLLAQPTSAVATLVQRDEFRRHEQRRRLAVPDLPA